MLGFEAEERISVTQKDVDRLRGDVEIWKSRHDEVARELWVWENLIAEANFVFGRIMRLDMDIQKILFRPPARAVDPVLLNCTRTLVAEWLDLALLVQPRAEQLLKEYGSVDGYQEMKSNIDELRAMATPDHEFFDSDDLAEARDKAIEDYRAGLTEPLSNNGHSTQ